MTTKEYLMQISRMDRMIKNKLSEIAQLRELSCSINISNENERVQTSSDKDKVGNVVAKIIDLETETDKLIDDYSNLKSQAYCVISHLKNEKYKEILVKKYIYGESIYNIAEDIGMTSRGCKKAHKKALEELDKINSNVIYSIFVDSSPQYMVK